jgi:ATP phosphoribosyltransferase
VAQTVLARIAAEETARLNRIIRVHGAAPLATALVDEACRLFAARPLMEGGAAPTLICPQAEAPALAQWLVEQGAGPVSVARLDYLFEAHNPLLETLLAGIDAPPRA